MEYYILKLYLQQQGAENMFARFDAKTKKKAIALLSVVILSGLVMIVAPLFSKNLLCILGAIVFLFAVVFTLRMIDTEQKNHMEEYVDSHKKNLMILEKILITEFGIVTAYKVRELINIYQDFVDAKEEEQQQRKKIVLTSFSVLAGVLSISFENMELIGIEVV